MQLKCGGFDLCIELRDVTCNSAANQLKRLFRNGRCFVNQVVNDQIGFSTGSISARKTSSIEPTRIESCIIGLQYNAESSQLDGSATLIRSGRINCPIPLIIGRIKG